MTVFSVIYEQADDGSWSVRAADLPVYAVGNTRDEAEGEIRAALALHLDELARSGQPVPELRSVIGEVTV